MLNLEVDVNVKLTLTFDLEMNEGVKLEYYGLLKINFADDVT